MIPLIMLIIASILIYVLEVRIDQSQKNAKGKK